MKTIVKSLMFALVSFLVTGAAGAQIRAPRAAPMEPPRITIEPGVIAPMALEGMQAALADMDMSLGEMGANLGDLSEISNLSELAGLSKLSGLSDLSEISGLAELSSLARLDALRDWSDLTPPAFPSRFGLGVANLPRIPGASPREAWAQGDPADSLYRAARQELNRQNFQLASTLFGRIRSQFPKSTYVADALYWDAYAQWRQGGEDRLRAALDLLEQQRREYPKAGNRSEATRLATRIRGELAQRGDPEAAEAVTALAAEVAVTPKPPTAPRPAAAPRVVVTTPRPSSGRGRLARVINDPDEVPSGCSQDDYEDKLAALNALLQMNSERAVPLLKGLLARRDECSAPLRRKAVFLVAQQKSPESADLLLDAVKNDPDLEVRKQGVFWLGQVEGDRPVDILGEILRTSDDVEMQKRAMFALSQHKSTRASEMIRQYAQRADAPVEMRKQAIFDIGQQQSTENAAFLRTLYGKLTEPELKERVLFSVSQMRGEGTGRWLLEVAANGKETIELRKKALFWAGQQSETNFSDFAGLYETMPDPEMKKQLIYVYSQRREPEAVDRLMEIARKETDRDLRKQAVFWLAQSRDPRVDKFLEDILNK